MTFSPSSAYRTGERCKDDVTLLWFMISRADESRRICFSSRRKPDEGNQRISVLVLQQSLDIKFIMRLVLKKWKWKMLTHPIFFRNSHNLQKRRFFVLLVSSKFSVDKWSKRKMTWTSHDSTVCSYEELNNEFHRK